MSNFDFLRDYDMELYRSGIKIEENVNSSPAAVKTYATPFLQRVLELLMAEIGQKFNPRKEFYYQLDAVYRQGKISYGFKQRIYGAYELRNRLHDTIEEMEKSEFMIARQLHEKLFNIAKKMYRDFYPDYDHYRGVPPFKPVEVDTSDDEVEFINIPDFSEVIDMQYDYCIVCGEPNHSNYSLCCEKCNAVMDNANNFISIRNSFGKDAELKKEDLIEYGIPEGYVNQLVSSMVREGMMEVKGIYITFNNTHLDDYLAKIDGYISVCELITRFREDKITAKAIKDTPEYRKGRLKQFPFYQFYKITNREIVKKFERYLTETEDVWMSMEYSAIDEIRLERWYKKRLASYRRGDVNDAFVIFNKVLIDEYLKMKAGGMLEGDIKAKLNVTDEVYEFWIHFDPKFTKRLSKIKIDLLSRAIVEGKSKTEIIEYAGVTAKEYDDLVKLSDFRKDDFSRLRGREIESRKEEFIKYLYNYDLEIACRKAKITLDDFYEYYDSANVNSRFYVKSTEYLMEKYLAQRRLAKTPKEAVENVGIRQIYVDRWLSRSAYYDFRDRNLQVTVDLILKGFKKRMSLDEISKITGVGPNTIRGYVKLGEKGSEMYKPLFEYYENVMIPERLSRFMEVFKNKNIHKALEASKLTFEELDKYYQLGKDGDERFNDFYDEFFDVKKRIYVAHLSKGKTHNIAMRESTLTAEEYDESKSDLERLLRVFRFGVVLEEIYDHKTSNVAASKAGCSVDEIYDWYFRGRDGDEDYEVFYESFHEAYIEPRIVPIQKRIDSENVSPDILIKSNRGIFTKKDFEIWIKHGLISIDVVHLEDDESDDDDGDSDKKTIKLKTRVSNTGRKSTLGRVESNDYDVEEMKREILGRRT